MDTYTADEEITGPELLSIPPKLLQILQDFNKYKIFVVEGGRGSAKSHTMGRLILYLMEHRKLRVVAGREVQNTLEESVYALLVDIIQRYKLGFAYNKKRIRSMLTSSTCGFKGLRERGIINVKGMEGVHLFWGDEAQAFTKPTLDTLIPTLRPTHEGAPEVKLLFTLNRLHREDAVMELTKRADCLHIHIDYFENPFCPLTLIDEAEQCRNRSERDYNHIWLGLPVKAGDEFIFDSDALYYSNRNTPYGDLFFKQKVIGIDWAAQGSDGIVATILERGSAEHWTLTKQERWDEPNTVISVGKILKLINEHKPEIVTIDIGGGGWNVYNDLLAANIKGVTIIPFDGGSTKGINSHRNINMRADGYWNLLDWFEKQWLCIGVGFNETLKQLERQKCKFRPDGKNQVREKAEYKKDHGHSPDEADSLMMAVYGIRYLAQAAKAKRDSNGNTGIVRKSGLKRRV